MSSAYPLIKYLVTWLLHLVSFTDKELTYSLFKDTNWLQNVSREAVRLSLLSFADKELTNSLVNPTDWLMNISECDLIWQKEIQRKKSNYDQKNFSPFTNPWLNVRTSIIPQTSYDLEIHNPISISLIIITILVNYPKIYFNALVFLEKNTKN